MATPAQKRATYEDVLAAPRTVVAEVIRGVLHTHPRPRAVHSRASSRLGSLLDPFDRERGGGPGGWIILDEPELHLGEEIVVPDLGGWRREHMPQLPDVAFFETAPDWICEVLSASTEAIDRTQKLPIYAEHHVRWVWFINPLLQTLEVFRLDGRSWRLMNTYSGDARVRAEPFESLELSLTDLWAR